MRRLKPFVLALAVAALAVASSALACPNHGSPWPSSWEPRSSYFRSCFSAHRTLAGAVEMYNLDFNTTITSLDTAMVHKLVDEGYLQSVPTCDSQTLGGVAGLHYAVATNPEETSAFPHQVFCLHHGFPGPDDQVSAHDQLGDLEQNQHLKARASRIPAASLRAVRQARWKIRRDRQDRFRSLLFAAGGAPLTALLSLLD